MRLRLLLLTLAALALAGPALWRWRGELLPQPAAAPSGRFALQDAGATVFDHISGLHWQQGFSATTMDWASAKTWCSANTPALPGSGWRLPSVRELRQLADRQTSAPAIDAAFGTTSNELFWSATPWVSGGYARYVNFLNGSSYYDSTTNTYRVRCVR